jgi:hypothetical protein
VTNSSPEATSADAVEAARQRVDAAIAELDAVADQPPAAQLPAFAAAHEALRSTLAGIDD